MGGQIPTAAPESIHGEHLLTLAAILNGPRDGRVLVTIPG
jgi:hypothetical protein